MQLRKRSWAPGHLGAVTVEVGLAALFVGALALWAVALAGSWGGRSWLFDAAVGSVVCLLARFRHRQQVVTAALGLLVAATAILVAREAQLPPEPGLATAVGLSVLIGSAVRAFPGWQAGIVAGVGLLVAVSTRLAVEPDTAFAHGNDVAGLTVINLCGWVVAVVIGMSLRLKDVRRRAETEQIRRDERLDLARELHDVVAHHISGIVVQTQGARIIARKHPEQLDRSLAGIEEAGGDALTAMRRIIGLLRDQDDGVPAGAGPEHLSDLVKRFDGHGPDVFLHLPDEEPDWPPEVTSTVYRIVQESLTNVARHATGAGSVRVDVTRSRESVVVEVADDASPGSAKYSHRRGYGLIGMRERIETLGGTLRTGPRPDGGWTVHATLPVPERVRPAR